MVCKDGRMGRLMKGTGKMTKPMDKANSNIVMGMYLKESGNVIWSMAMASILMSMVLSMKENGNMICSTDSETKCGTTVQNTQVSTGKVENMVRANTLGKMAQIILGIGLIIR